MKMKIPRIRKKVIIAFAVGWSSLSCAWDIFPCSAGTVILRISSLQKSPRPRPSPLPMQDLSSMPPLNPSSQIFCIPRYPVEFFRKFFDMSRGDSRRHGYGILATTRQRSIRIRFTIRRRPAFIYITLTVTRGDGALKNHDRI